ncbi:MAG: hypothetical protein AB8B85_01630 [Paracoccaceae bacterium]
MSTEPDDIQEIETEATEVVEPDRDYDAEAREMGWLPKEEFRGPEDRWRPADEFVKRGEEILPIVNAKNKRLEERLEKQERQFEERTRRLESMTEKAIARQKEQFEAAQKRIAEQKRVAVADADTETYERLEAEEKSLTPPDIDPAPQTSHEAEAEFAGKNPWYNTDPLARSLAIAESQRVAAIPGSTVEQQLKAAEDAVKLRFPEHFPKPVPPPGGGATHRTAAPKRSHGVNDLPPEAVSAAKSFIAQGIYKDMAEYAKDYFEEA